MAERQLRVTIIGDDASLNRALGKSGAAVSGFGDKMAAVGSRVSAVGRKMTMGLTLPVLVAGGAAFKMADDYTDATATVQKHIETMGVGGVVSFKGLSDSIRGFSMETGIAQTELLGASGKLVTFANVAHRGTGFINEATRAAADLSASGFGSIQSASVMLGKAFDNPIKGLTSLTRVGVSFSTKQQEVIKKLVATGQTAKAQGIIMKAVQSQVGGTAKTIADPWDKAKVTLQAAAITIGTQLMPVVARIANVVATLVGKFEALSPSTKKVILIAAGLVAAIGPLVSVVGSLTTAIGFLIANPVTLLIAGIAVLAGAIAAAVIWPDKLKSVLERMGLSAHDAGRVVAGLQDAFAVAKDAAMKVVAVIRENWPQIKAIATEVFDVVKTVITTTVQVVEGVWKRFGRSIKEEARIAWDYVKGTVKNGLETIRGIIDVISGLIHGDWARVWKGIKEIVGGTLKQVWNQLSTAVKTLGTAASAVGSAIWNGLKNGATGVLNWIIGKINWLIDRFNGIASWIGVTIDHMQTIGGGWNGPKGVHGGGPQGPNLPAHAAGGIFTRPHLALIAERGPELILPLTSAMPPGGSPLPSGWSGHGGHSAGRGGDVIIHLNGTYIGGKRQLEEEIVNGLSRFARRNGNQALRAVLGATGA